MTKKYIIAGLALVALVLFGAMNLRKSVTPYVGMKEAMATTTSVQVAGKLVKGSKAFDNSAGLLKFTLYDDKGMQMNVDYPKAAPANFDDAESMVVKGQFSDGVFHAEEILVKCPSKYEKKGPGDKSTGNS